MIGAQGVQPGLALLPRQKLIASAELDVPNLPRNPLEVLAAKVVQKVVAEADAGELVGVRPNQDVDLVPNATENGAGGGWYLRVLDHDEPLAPGTERPEDLLESACGGIRTRDIGI